MKIKELYIKAFGRFTDRRIVPGDGLNIIYGLNEGGKSTVHRFIEAMLFGFVKPGVKRRVLMEEYDRYRPWTGNLYGGSLVYQVDGGLYKVERNLEKGRESVRVFDHISGEEVTRRFTYDKARKELMFAREHLGLSQTVYRNTISISQLGSKSDAELAREIQARLGGLGGTGDTGLSVAKAEKLIREYLDGIGTERAQTREYGRLCRRVEELQEGIEWTAASVESIRSMGAQLKEDERRAADLKAEREGLERRVKACRDGILLGRWQAVQSLLEEYENLAQQLEECEEYSGFDTTDSDELITLQQLTQQDRREINKLRMKIEETSRDMEDVKRTVLESADKGAGFARRRFNGSLGLAAASVCAAVGLTILAAALDNPALNILSVPLLVLFMYSIGRAARIKGLLKEQEVAERELETEQQYMEKYRDDLLVSLLEREGELVRKEERISAILHKCGAAGMEEYRYKADGFERYNRLKSRLEQVKMMLEIRLDGESREALEQKAKAVMATGASPMVEPAAEMAVGDAAGAGPIAKPAAEMAAAGAGGADGLPSDVPDSADALDGVPPAGTAGFNREALEDWEKRLRHIREEEARLLAGIEKARGGMEALERSIAGLPEMDEELSYTMDRLERLKAEREAAEIALETIREASASVHREFAPTLNRKVNEITSRITGDRYTDLQITGNLEVLVTAPETGRRIQAEVLSGGTVDQLYFALRIAAAELVSGGRKLPLFLDDSFAQYDCDRLENVMRYLFEEARERQVMIFTCSGREKEVAEALGGVYNYLVID